MKYYITLLIILLIEFICCRKGTCSLDAYAGRKCGSTQIYPKVWDCDSLNSSIWLHLDLHAHLRRLPNSPPCCRALYMLGNVYCVVMAVKHRWCLTVSRGNSRSQQKFHNCKLHSELDVGLRFGVRVDLGVRKWYQSKWQFHINRSFILCTVEPQYTTRPKTML